MSQWRWPGRRWPGTLNYIPWEEKEQGDRILSRRINFWIGFICWWRETRPKSSWRRASWNHYNIDFKRILTAIRTNSNNIEFNDRRFLRLATNSHICPRQFIKIWVASIAYPISGTLLVSFLRSSSKWLFVSSIRSPILWANGV